MSRVSNILLTAHPDDISIIERMSNWLEESAPVDDRFGHGRGVGRLAAVTNWGGWKHPECTMFAGALNLADMDSIVEAVAREPWEYPEDVQLFLRDADESVFALWMFRFGTLQRVTPDTHTNLSLSGLGNVRLRWANISDVSFLVANVEELGIGQFGLIEEIMACRFSRLPERLEPLFIIALRDTKCSAGGWSWLPVGAGYLWSEQGEERENERNQSMYVAIGLPEKARVSGLGELIAENLIEAAFDRGVTKLLAAVDRNDGWLTRVYQSASFLMEGDIYFRALDDDRSPADEVDHGRAGE